MASITLHGNPVHTSGSLPSIGTQAKDFKLIKEDLSTASLSDFAGKNIVMNIFPSIDTGVCATSVREFNKRASELDNTVVLCISRDLPFAQKRFCAAEGLDNVMMLSDFNDGKFGKDYGLEMTDNALANLHSRAIVIADKDGKVTYTEQVGEIGDEPNYDAAIAAV